MFSEIVLSCSIQLMKCDQSCLMCLNVTPGRCDWIYSPCFSSRAVVSAGFWFKPAAVQEAVPRSVSWTRSALWNVGFPVMKLASQELAKASEGAVQHHSATCHRIQTGFSCRCDPPLFPYSSFRFLRSHVRGKKI